MASDLSQLAATTTSSHVLLVNLPDYFEVLYTPHTLYSGAVQFFTHVKIVVCAWHFCILSQVFFVPSTEFFFFLNVHSCVSMCYIETTVVGFFGVVICVTRISRMEKRKNFTPTKKT